MVKVKEWRNGDLCCALRDPLCAPPPSAAARQSPIFLSAAERCHTASACLNRLDIFPMLKNGCECRDPVPSEHALQTRAVPSKKKKKVPANDIGWDL